MSETPNENGTQERRGHGFRVKRLVSWFFDFRTTELWHPESPGMKVTVTRSRFGRLFKPSAFATLGECLKSGLVWRNYGKILESGRSERRMACITCGRDVVYHQSGECNYCNPPF